MDREGRRPERRPTYSEYDDQFDETHRSFSDKVERLLTQMVAVGLVILAIVQTLHTNDYLRRLMVYLDRLEGVDAAALQTPPDRTVAVSSPRVRTTVTVLLVTRRSEPAAILLVNGRSAGNFRNGSVTAAVAPGHEIAVDGRAVRERLRFRIVAAPGLAEPASGKETFTEGSLTVLGTARAGR